jgi:hypothetical protein
MKNLKVLFFVALFTPWIPRAEASPLKFQETVLLSDTQQLSGVDTLSEVGVFSPLKINNDRINNQGATFYLAQVKRFPGGTITSSGGVAVPIPDALNVKRFSGNTGVRQVILSNQVIQNLTAVGDKFLLDFTKNTLFNSSFSSQDLGQIAVDTNNQLAAGALWETIDKLTLTFDGTTTTFETLDALNAKMYDIISNPGLTEGSVKLNIFGVEVTYENIVVRN